MYRVRVPDLSKFKKFEWDKGNIEKSYKKHGISPEESEELFLDESVLLQEDIKHIQTEGRYIAIGKSSQKRILFAIFTIRGEKIRIISVRIAKKKERRR